MYVQPSEYLAPAIAIVVGVLPVLYFRRKGALLGLAAFAYFLAIGAKAVLESVFLGFFQSATLASYLAYGLLTFVFEVGLAYAFLRLAWTYEVSSGPSHHAGWTYGTYLAFFENAVLLGALPLLGLLAVSSSGIHAPASGDPYAANVLPLAFPYVLERLSSLIAHAVWGLLVYVALWQRRPILVLTVLPLAMIDALAAGWDFTHFVSYPVLVVLLLGYTLVTSALALYLSGIWGTALRGLGRPRPPRVVGPPPRAELGPVPTAPGVPPSPSTPTSSPGPVIPASTSGVRFQGRSAEGQVGQDEHQGRQA